MLGGKLGRFVSLNSLSSSVVVAFPLARTTAHVTKKETVFTPMVDVVKTRLIELTRCPLLELLTCATGKYTTHTNLK